MQHHIICLVDDSDSRKKALQKKFFKELAFKIRNSIDKKLPNDFIVLCFESFKKFQEKLVDLGANNEVTIVCGYSYTNIFYRQVSAVSASNKFLVDMLFLEINKFGEYYSHRISNYSMKELNPLAKKIMKYNRSIFYDI